MDIDLSGQEIDLGRVRTTELGAGYIARDYGLSCRPLDDDHVIPSGRWLPYRGQKRMFESRAAVTEAGVQ